MKELVIMKNKQAVTDSLNVSKNFGKNHRDVLRAIDNIAKEKGVAQNSADPQGNKIFAEGVYEHPQNHQKYRIIYMNRRGFVLLAMGFTGKRAFEFKNKYIDAFDAMELKLREQQPRLPQTPTELLNLTVKSTLETAGKVKKVENRVTNLEENAMLSPGEYNYISRRVNHKVSEYIQVHHLSLNVKQRSKLFRDINRQINEVSGIKTRTQLRKKHFDTVDKFITNWAPSASTVELIKQLNGEVKGQQELIN
ncbi:Rha family transcriptional regulator [Liquorilactobacillus satsumensis]|uniref:Rha family transcriptional regulator n=1 Tax=Liquorilactobacillus TaxID=2767888 RepID=UPI0021C38551|nr:Rha family transcriptional regulator [Liquorilactobacillus satsumensis]MCP9313842.1 ORF6C domain-containing protein [Liquorilactobacillus satsumensis]MCP9360983.1 ORF6C domain-containing protein [Liquorilactobacillus satsumensis]